MSNTTIRNCTSSKELFDQYDTDGSGHISFDEFAQLLTNLGFHFTEAKQVEYFRFCDQDNDGSIDFEEFRVALFVCDENENKDAFNPGNILRPRDAFNLFDKDSTGSLDEDEFRYVLEYLGIDIDDETHDKIFRKYDKNDSGLIEYNEFKRAWLTLVNPRKELTDRGVQIPTLATHSQIVRMLESVLNQEEEREAKAIETAKDWAFRQKVLKNRTDIFNKALDRYHLELSLSLDLAGQVYIFGDGTSNRFHEAAIEVEELSHHCKENELLQFLWRRKLIRRNDLLERKDYPLCEINVKQNTFDLWGKEPSDIGITESSIVVLCKSSELYSWDSKHQQWIQNSSQTTTSDASAQINIDDEENEVEIDDYGVIKNVLQYYSKWKAPPRNCNFHKHAHSVLQSEIRRDELARSLELRGKNSDNFTKLELVKLMHIELNLEQNHLGQEAFHRLKKTEEEISSLRALQKKKIVKRKLQQFSELRKCVSEAAKSNNKEFAVETTNEEVNVTKTAYSSDIESEEILMMRSKWLSLVSGAKYAGLLSESGQVFLCSRKSHGNENSMIYSHLKLPLSEKAINFSCGYSHSAVVSENGNVFVWDSSSTNKLGIASIHSNNLYIEKPSKLHMGSISVTKVSCGASHTGCVTSHGKVFMWGSNAGYRLGLGDTIDRNVPTLAENILNQDIHDISCGYCQTMLITKIEHTLQVQNGMKISRISGGRLLVAGPQSALGSKFSSFGLYPSFLKDSKNIDPVPIKDISAGFSHQSAVSIEGELYTFGDNTGGCCAHPTREKFISIPTHVKYLFNSTLNLLSGKRINKSIPYCYQPYYEVDLGETFTIEEIKIWNWLDLPSNPASSKDKSGLRLFPCWIMISQDELPRSEGSLDSALNLSVTKKRLEENFLVTSWNPQIRTRGRFIRVQLEETNLLEFEKIQIFGHSALENPIGRVNKAVCGKRLTGVIIKATDDSEDIELSLERVNAAKNMKLPVHYETIRCRLCESSSPCEICKLKETMVKEGLRWEAESDLSDLGKIFLNPQNIKV